MHDCVCFNNNNFRKLIEINENRQRFNILNEDFVSYYNELNFFKRLLIHNKVKLLIKNNKIQGYIWVYSNDDGYLYINSMYVYEDEDIINNYKLLLNSFKNNYFIYYCKKNHNNFEVLTGIGFAKGKGTLKMNMNLKNINYQLHNNLIEFEVLNKGKQEELRCNIQNEVFRNDARMPLTIDDMYYDEYQNYYYENGAIFIKYNKEYAGYGQIILNDNEPTIVNVGILKKYRGKGLGRLLMMHLLNLLIEQGFKEVNLKVSSDNLIALSMYKSFGFEVVEETFIWEYKK